jgi:7-carboxy-7-deazaguanine synthase
MPRITLIPYLPKFPRGRGSLTDFLVDPAQLSEQVGDVEKTLKINEIFYSIQGESTHAGRPCTFVRLSGCPLRCHYCDTEYAFYEGEVFSFSQILEKIKSYPTNLVEVTGGEPLAQKETKEFLDYLVEQGFEVLMETSGAISIEGVNPKVSVILDVKTPTSGESQKHKNSNIALLKPHKDEVKFVIESKADFEFMENYCREFRLLENFTVLVSPSWNKIELSTLADWILGSQKPYRMQTQLHKYIWGAEARGV